MTPQKKKLFRKLVNKLSREYMDPLRLYQPTPHALEFHRADVPERLALGSNRGGKTLAACVEFAWAVRGLHPYIQYPKENGRAIIVGKDGKQLGQVLYRKLFRAGAFKMIPDEETGLYRVYEPWRDESRVHLCKPSLPLIPHRMVADVAWENRAEDVPHLIKLRNGWELIFVSSQGTPPQGLDVDIVMFDEEIREISRENDWYAEMSARLVDRRGRFLWSATPQSATMRLFELHERALDEQNEENPRIREFMFRIADNPYISEEDKLTFIKKFANDPESYRVRVEGQFLLTTFRVYQNFNMETHGVPWFQIPKDWCRYMVVDPGYAHTGCVFFAIPPDESRVYVYDELFIDRCTAQEFARQLKPKLEGQNIEEFIIDLHGSRKTESSGKTIAEQYSEEMEHFGCWSISTGSEFIQIGDEGWTAPGTLKAEVQQVRSWLWEREEGKPPKLAVLHGAAPKFVEQMTKYRNKKDKPDEPEQKKYAEGPDCLRYLVLRDPRHVAPRTPPKRQNPLLKRLKEKRKKRQKTGQYILLG